jgi:uncharacterized glyoxalase superfamily protein PhnB
MKIQSITPFLACKDIEQSLAFYVDVLGFEKDWTWDDPITNAGVRCGAFCIYLSDDTELATRIEGSEVCICVEDLEAVYKTHKENGAPIVSDLETKPWGLTEYSVKDPSGHILLFGA